MSSPLQASTLNRSEVAGHAPAIAETMAESAMTNNDQRTLWQRHRMPIILGVIALCLYLGSIAWMVYARSQLG